MERHTDEDVGSHDVALRGNHGDFRGRLTVIRGATEWQLTLSAGQRNWHGSGGDLFSALRDLRQGLDQDHLLIGLNGARLECGVCGMLADMGEGRQAYVLTIPRTNARPETVRTLRSAPLNEVSDVVSQDEHKRLWLAEASPHDDR